MEKHKLVSMVDFILAIDWLGTKEFCEKYKLPEPYYTGDVKSSAAQFINLDVIKGKMFLEYAKFLNKKLALEMFIGPHKKIDGFTQVDSRGGNITLECGKYTITIDEHGFYLEPYDSVDGERVTRIEDLAGLDIQYIQTRFPYM